MSAEVLTSTEGPVATITLNRPNRLNALYPGLYTELLTALDTVKDDDGVRCVILAGAGRAFCAGGDMDLDVGTLADLDGVGALDLSEHAQRVVEALWSLPKPIIAKVHGAAVGGGFDMALACDLVVAADDARFGHLWTRNGIVSDMGGPWLLAQLIGLHRAKELVFSGRIVDAVQAHQMGLCNRVVPMTELDHAVEELAVELASMPMHAIAMAKQLMHATVGQPLPRYLYLANLSVSAMGDTSDHRQAIAAFKGRRGHGGGQDEYDG